MTKENEKLRDCLRDAESIITNALRSQPEGDNECKIHLTKAVKDVLGLVYEAKSQMPDGSKYAMEGMGHPSAHDRPSNAAALRGALKVIRRMVNEELEDLKDISDEVRADFISIRGWCDHALAEPPRNCDVGTADEQESRFEEYCDSNYSQNDVDEECWRCPLLKPMKNCTFSWAQMPYENARNERESRFDFQPASLI